MPSLPCLTRDCFWKLLSIHSRISGVLCPRWPSSSVAGRWAVHAKFLRNLSKRSRLHRSYARWGFAREKCVSKSHVKLSSLACSIDNAFASHLIWRTLYETEPVRMMTRAILSDIAICDLCPCSQLCRQYVQVFPKFITRYLF